jgi:hypothetical protein
MEQFHRNFGYPISMKRSELTTRQKQLVPCPICGAAIGEQYYAIQAIEHGYGRYELLRTFIRVETAHIWQTSDSTANS